VAFEVSIPRSTHATLSILDVAGRRVRQVGDDAWDAGVHRLSWDGANQFGQRVAAGMYFARLKTSDGSRTQSILILR
jgi:flagellar hook assembly protein FlgD